MNKKGADKIIAIYWFMVLILVAGGVFIMVYVFYHHPLDVRELEASVLSDKFADCLSTQGKLNPDLFDVNGDFEVNFKSNFLGRCHLNFDPENKDDAEQYYFKINFYELADTSNSVFEISEGNKNWQAFCNVQEDKEYEKLVKCLEKRFYSTKDQDQYLIKILSVVGKTEKNVK